jgi:hypothetical protein
LHKHCQNQGKYKQAGSNRLEPKFSREDAYKCREQRLAEYRCSNLKPNSITDMCGSEAYRGRRDERRKTGADDSPINPNPRKLKRFVIFNQIDKAPRAMPATQNRIILLAGTNPIAIPASTRPAVSPTQYTLTQNPAVNIATARDCVNKVYDQVPTAASMPV